MSRAERRKRRGMSVIEVLIGFVILVVAGVGLVTLLGQGSHAMSSMARSERETREAAEILDRYAIASRAELVARIGLRRANGYDVDVSAAGPALFAVTVSDTGTRAVLLRTVFYLPDSANATP
jgi:Tfp pilus assembly protein PilV